MFRNQEAYRGDRQSDVAFSDLGQTVFHAGRVRFGSPSVQRADPKDTAPECLKLW